MLLKSISSYNAIYLFSGSTDLRKSVDGLANIIKNDFKMDPFGNYLYLFCNRARNRLKGISWDKNGFCLCYKRLDGAGAKFQWPNDPDSVRDVKISQLRMLLDGLSVDPPRGFGEITARDF